MIFTETPLLGCFIIEMEPNHDVRGFFSRMWCKKEFSTHGLIGDFVQGNISFNQKKGTLRGMHYQCAPFEEAKLVSCVKGAIYDVVIDLRQDSKTYKESIAMCLSENNHRMLYVPAGFAHGFQTLEEETSVLYQMSEYYAPSSSRGIRYNDPSFNFNWPISENIVISDKDMGYEDYM